MYCLVSIVKNEEANITRLLDSVVNVVEEYVIVDTGSTDGTVDLIRQHPLRGHVVHHTFVNFQESRNKSLEAARQHSTASYFLFLDADMELVATPDFLAFTGQVGDMIQSHASLSYRNVRVVHRDVPGVQYIGVTHEYLSTPNVPIHHFPENVVCIKDHGDGGCKADKFERDIRLLTTYLQDHPDDARSMFYLAESFHHSDQHREAIEWYQRRICAGGWEQEVWYSQFKILKCYIAMGKLDDAKSCIPPTEKSRAEAMYHLCRALREAGRHHEAFYYCMRAKTIPFPDETTTLFVERHVYSYLLDFEASILWFYISPREKRRGLELTWRVLSNSQVPESTWWCAHDNLMFYLSSMGGQITRTLPLEFEPGWYFTTPTMIGKDVSYRLVNYTIGPDGSYDMPDGIVRTRNWWSGRGVLEHDESQAPVQADINIKGFEDLRVTRDAQGDIYALATSWEYCPRPNSLSQVLLRIDPDSLQTFVVKVLSNGEVVEKNWVWFVYPYYIYHWYPEIEIRSVEDESYRRHVASWPCMRGMRGSSNGCLYKDQWWFITHSVIHGRTPIRHYLHYLVVLDKECQAIQHVSPPFTFDTDADVEFSTLLRVDDEGIVVGYSSRDRNVKWRRLDWQQWVMDSWRKPRRDEQRGVSRV